jgi:Uma2 family endonuclease
MTWEEFVADDSGTFVEWVNGRALPMMSVSSEHSRVTTFVLHLLGSFVDFHGVGAVFADPFVMRLGPGLSGRSPDVMFVGREHAERVETQFLDGPADVAVEVISPASAATDRGEKYYEYEAAGIPEYWLLDPQRKVAEFYRLDAAGVYRLVPSADGVFRSEALPGFFLRVAWLWERPRLADAERELGLR